MHLTSVLFPASLCMIMSMPCHWWMRLMCPCSLLRQRLHATQTFIAAAALQTDLSTFKPHNPSHTFYPQVQELQSTPRKAALGHSLPQSPHSSNGDGGELRGGNQQVWQLRAQLEAAQKVQPYRHSLDLLAQGSRGLALQVPPSACPVPYLALHVGHRMANARGVGMSQIRHHEWQRSWGHFNDPSFCADCVRRASPLLPCSHDSSRSCHAAYFLPWACML